MQQRSQDSWKDAEPQLEPPLHSSIGLGAVHHSAVQRLRGSEYVHHGLSRPESALLDDVIQLEQRAERNRSVQSQRSMANCALAFPHVVPHLSAADGQSPVEHRPGHGLFTTRRRHGAHIAVITVEIPRRRDEVAEAKVWDHRAAACTETREGTQIW